MSLPPILRHIYNHGTEEVIRRGKKIFATSGVQMLDADHLVGQVRFRVRNDLYQNYYTVTVSNYPHPAEMAVRCQCPYNLGEICRHEAAALFQLNEIIQSGVFDSEVQQYDQKHTVVRIRQITPHMLRVCTSSDILDRADELARQLQVRLIPGKTDRIEAVVTDEGDEFDVTIKQNEDRYFDTSCRCAESKHPVCLHKAAVFLYILRNHGATYFQSAYNSDFQKNKLLEQYGFSLKDNLTNKFAFTIEGGKPFLRVLDPSLKKVGVLAQSIKPKEAEIKQKEAEVIEPKRLGVVLDSTLSYFPYVEVLLVEGLPDAAGTKFVGPVARVELNQYINLLRYPDGDRDILPVIRKFQQEEIVRYLRKNLPFGDFIPDTATNLDFRLAEDTKDQVWEYLLPKYHKLVDRFAHHPFTYLRKKGKLISSAGLQKIDFSDRLAHPQVIVRKNEVDYTVTLEWIIDHNAVASTEVTVLNPGLLLHDGCLFSVSNLQELTLAGNFPPDGQIRVELAEWDDYLKKYLMVWNEQVHVHFSEELIERLMFEKPGIRIYLQERDHVLVIRPVFVYEGQEVKPSSHGDVLLSENGIVKIVKRNQEIETEFLQLMQSVHSDIHFHKKEQFFTLSEMLVLSGNWFGRFVDLMKEWKAEILGYSNLKNLKVNVFKPDTKMFVSSGIDWFDAAVEVTFGDQTVTVADLKKALVHKQNFVKLADGTIGMLPEEWVRKYGLLFKMGENKAGKLRLKKLHFSLVDELATEVEQEAMPEELLAKKEKLEAVLDRDYTDVAPPEHLQAVLRPYQLAGFHWIKFLNESGWGGILADDMGLGKTIQTLAFFQHYKNNQTEVCFLVVCPTTLVYNWVREVEKFTPELAVFIHHGPKRNVSANALRGFDIIVTTYGTMRSDIKMLREIEFDYAVLDESQSIKNPQSQVAKAALLLNSKNRLALSGTPVQNNTFDLYSQMNFLNPGMLGSREFFMNEFANPIDKFREEEVKQELRKLTYPFLLRRSKEQVAKDLPEKTETILYCEMGKEQRKIYDTYRNLYRSRILGMIEEKGMEKSQLHILQGLTKLRQICDSPAILNEEDRFPNHSAKSDELARELAENLGDHKVLIFSQFLGMLALIRQKLVEDGIEHVYFDGGSTAVEREAAINEFQNNHDCRVFLISLKAGGIGLNLTAADYVYIVDPWWNPAVEQQAIDRTHRIGQTKNIFAYRLICKDSLEEKMLQLQEQKRNLANDLISDDNTIMKRLTKDDVAFLFS